MEGLSQPFKQSLPESLCKSVVFHGDLSDSFKKFYPAMCVLRHNQDRSDIGQYQTPTKVWDYLNLSIPFVASDSKSLRFYMQDFPGVAWVSLYPTADDIVEKVDELAVTKVAEKEYSSVIKRGKDLYMDNLAYILACLRGADD